MGFKRSLIAIVKTISFTFCQIAENVSFFEHMNLKFAESANIT
jgi:hypothetical protein